MDFSLIVILTTFTKKSSSLGLGHKSAGNVSDRKNDGIPICAPLKNWSSGGYILSNPKEWF